MWSSGGKNQAAYDPALTDTAPCGSDDAYLINEHQQSGTAPTK
jgi:hypothetical protein